MLIIIKNKCWSFWFKHKKNNYSDKETVQVNATDILKEDKFEEVNEKKREKRQRDDNIDKEKESCVS